MGIKKISGEGSAQTENWIQLGSCACLSCLTGGQAHEADTWEKWLEPLIDRLQQITVALKWKVCCDSWRGVCFPAGNPWCTLRSGISGTLLLILLGFTCERDTRFTALHVSKNKVLQCQICAVFEILTTINLNLMILFWGLVCLQWTRALLWGKVQLMGAFPCQYPHIKIKWGAWLLSKRQVACKEY